MKTTLKEFRKMLNNELKKLVEDQDRVNRNADNYGDDYEEGIDRVKRHEDGYGDDLEEGVPQKEPGEGPHMPMALTAPRKIIKKMTGKVVGPSKKPNVKVPGKVQDEADEKDLPPDYMKKFLGGGDIGKTTGKPGEDYSWSVTDPSKMTRSAVSGTNRRVGQVGKPQTSPEQDKLNKLLDKDAEGWHMSAKDLAKMSPSDIQKLAKPKNMPNKAFGMDIPNAPSSPFSKGEKNQWHADSGLSPDVTDTEIDIDPALEKGGTDPGGEAPEPEYKTNAGKDVGNKPMPKLGDLTKKKK